MFPNLMIRGASRQLDAQLSATSGAALHRMRVPKQAELAIHVVPLMEMEQINMASRGISHPTDVLTFPGPGSGTKTEEFIDEILFAHDCVDTNVNRRGAPAADDAALQYERRLEMLDLGGIYLCPEYICLRCRTAPRKNLPLAQYSLAAIVHALLHALGYDHETEDSLAAMVVQEKKLTHHILRMRSLRRIPCEINLLEYSRGFPRSVSM